MTSNSRLLELLEGYEVDKVIELIKENIREEAAKSTGKKNLYTILKRVLKDGSRIQYTVGHKVGEKIAFLDGHRMFLTDNDYGFEVVDKPDYRYINNLENFLPQNTYDLKEVEIDLAELRYFIKVWGKKKKAYMFHAGNTVIGVNPHYLKDLIDFTGSNKILVSKWNAPIFSKNLDALLLPVNNGIRNISDYQTWYSNHIKEVA